MSHDADPNSGLGEDEAAQVADFDNESKDAAHRHFQRVDKSDLDLWSIPEYDTRLLADHWKGSTAIVLYDPDALADAISATAIAKAGFLDLFLDRSTISVCATYKSVACRADFPLVEPLAEDFAPLRFRVDAETWRGLGKKGVFPSANVKLVVELKENLARIGIWRNDPISSPQDWVSYLSLAIASTKHYPLSRPQGTGAKLSVSSVKRALAFVSPFLHAGARKHASLRAKQRKAAKDHHLYRGKKPHGPEYDQILIDDGIVAYRTDDSACRISDAGLKGLSTNIAKEHLSDFRKVLGRYPSEIVDVLAKEDRLYVSRNGFFASTVASRPTIKAQALKVFNDIPDVWFDVDRLELTGRLLLASPALVNSKLSKKNGQPIDRLSRLLRLKWSKAGDEVTLNIFLASPIAEFMSSLKAKAVEFNNPELEGAEESSVEHAIYIDVSKFLAAIQISDAPTVRLGFLLRDEKVLVAKTSFSEVTTEVALLSMA